MQCVCCLIQSDSKKDFTLFTFADQKLYHELTRLELDHKKKLKICKDCKNLLKKSTLFINLCKKSHEQLIVNQAIIEETLKITDVRTSRKRLKQLEPDEETNDFSCTINDERDEDSEGDNLPISALKQKIKDQNVTPVGLVEPIHEEVIQEEVKTIEIFVPSPKPESKYLCACGMSFKTSQSLQVHSFTHSGIKNFKCDECEKGFATRFRLKAHTRIHTGERPFVCDVCSLSFAQGNALKCHKRVHTKERPFVCKICSKSFSQNTTLKTHMAALHLGKTVECDEPGCDKKFTRRSYLLIHKRDHVGERKYACDRCPNQYKQKSHLDRHIAASHLGIRHKCDFPHCTAEFSKSWSLKMHKFGHMSEPSQLPYQCLLCDIGFQRRDKLLKHRARTHPEGPCSVKVKGETSETQVETKEIQPESQSKSSFLVLASTPEIYTIQNSDGSFTEVQTLEVIEEK